MTSFLRKESEMDRENKPKPWREKKGILKQKFSDLSDEDLTYKPGKEGELLSHLQKKLGKSREEIKRIIKSL
jgi:uncharacterized protein YjbJ (UPF0337 family)